MKTSPKESFCSLQRGRPSLQTPYPPLTGQTDKQSHECSHQLLLVLCCRMSNISTWPPRPLRSLSPAEDIHTMSICQRNLFVPKYWQSSSLRRNHFSQFARTNPFWMGQADGRNQACKAEDRMLSVVCRQLHSVEIRNENEVELDLT